MARDDEHEWVFPADRLNTENWDKETQVMIATMSSASTMLSVIAHDLARFSDEDRESFSAAAAAAVNYMMRKCMDSIIVFSPKELQDLYGRLKDTAEETQSEITEELGDLLRQLSEKTKKARHSDLSGIDVDGFLKDIFKKDQN